LLWTLSGKRTVSNLAQLLAVTQFTLESNRRVRAGPDPQWHLEDNMDTTTLLIIIIIVLLVGGGGWYGRGRWF
jgi:hypothetical protein